jgi:hypothetical protein
MWLTSEGVRLALRGPTPAIYRTGMIPSTVWST